MSTRVENVVAPSADLPPAEHPEAAQKAHTLVQACEREARATYETFITIARIKASITVHLSKQAEREVNEPVLQAAIDCVKAEDALAAARKAARLEL